MEGELLAITIGSRALSDPSRVWPTTRDVLSFPGPWEGCDSHWPHDPAVNNDDIEWGKTSSVQGVTSSGSPEIQILSGEVVAPLV